MHPSTTACAVVWPAIAVVVDKVLFYDDIPEGVTEVVTASGMPPREAGLKLKIVKKCVCAVRVCSACEPARSANVSACVQCVRA